MGNKYILIYNQLFGSFLEQKKHTGELSNAKRPGRLRKTTVVDDRNTISDQEHSPGGRCICVKVNNQEKTSPE